MFETLILTIFSEWAHKTSLILLILAIPLAYAIARIYAIVKTHGGRD